MVKTLNPRIRAADVMPDVLGVAQIAAGGVGTSELGAAAVTSGKIASGQVGATHVFDASVISGKVASGQIGAAHIYNDAVTSGKIASGQIGAAHIYDDAVTSGKVISGGIGAAHLYARGGLASGAGDSGFSYFHNFGATPSRENVYLTPRESAAFWVTAVNNSAVIISTSVSGTGCDVKVFR